MSAVAELIKLPGVWRGGELEHATRPSIPTGHALLDAELPGGGWPTGTLAEVLHEGVGIGEVSFLCRAIAQACGEARMAAWINPPHLPYAPALAQSGLPLDRCLVVRPVSREDALWAAEQALKSGACGAVLMWIEATQTGRAGEYAWMRRLQMAAEAGRVMAVVFRPTSVERQSTPAHLRIVLAREDGALRARIPKRRGPPLARSIEIRAGYSCAPSRIEPAAHPVRVAARKLHLVSR
ncbi:MAG TPA: translesion DNA synthesis-associated protein ImuA [Usitatibacter sp.]|nr:translesion DNA synthesis-associated protein ImuA [Usitatibacter sp.]